LVFSEGRTRTRGRLRLTLRRCTLLSPATLAGLAATAPGASATSSTVRVGIADQSANMFASPPYKALDLKRTRYFIEWTAIRE